MTDSTLLLRQINPNFVQNGRITSQAFRPTPKDEQCLSVYDGDMIEPESAYDHFTQTLKFKSCGIMGVTVSECTKHQLEVRSDPEPFPEHAIIDFSEYSKKDTEKKAKLLKHVAQMRGWLFQID